MAKIIIGNVDNDSMVGDLRNFTASQRMVSAAVAHRLLWVAQPEDILVMPYDVSPEMIAHMAEIRGVVVDPERIVTPGDARSAPVILTSDELLASDLLGRVRDLMAGDMAGGADWEVLAYFPTASVVRFAIDVGARVAGGGESFLEQGGAELFNSKSFFRKACAANGFSCAPGVVCGSLAQLLRAVPELMRETGAVMLKEEFHSGGDGNVLITYHDRTQAPGACEVVRVASASELGTALIRLWPRFVSGRNVEVIAETFFDARAVIYSEFEIDAGGAIHHLDHGVMRMQPLWCGFEIPGRLSTLSTTHFAAASQQITAFARDQGYRGKINLDALVLADGRIVFTEFNGRLGGCTHIDVAARELLGPRYIDEVAIVTINKVASPPWPELTALLAEGFAFDRQARRGVIVLTEVLPLNGTIEIMTVEADMASAEALERRFLAALAALAARREAAAAPSIAMSA